LSGFRAFHAEVVRLRDEVLRQPWIAGAGGGGGGSTGASGATTEASGAGRDRVFGIQAELDGVLQRLEAAARTAGGSRGGSRMRDAGYFMAALADEIFLTLSWDGNEAWSQHLLEGRLYASHAAGETVFARAEQILSGGEDREMAAVILCALALGFEGQFRGRGAAGERAIRDLKARLLSFIHRGSPGAGGAAGDGLFPQVYQHTLETQPVVRLPRVASWTLLVVALIVVQLLVSHWVWVNISASIRQVTDGLVWLQGGPSL
jgi:type VI secretion system protein ImpK